MPPASCLSQVSWETGLQPLGRAAPVLEMPGWCGGKLLRYRQLLAATVCMFYLLAMLAHRGPLAAPAGQRLNKKGDRRALQSCCLVGASP